MTVPKTLPAPRRNQTAVGASTRYDDIASTDIVVATGDYTGGTTEQLFTASSHGMSDGDIVYCLGQSAQGTVLGGPGTRAIVDAVDANTFHLTTDGTTSLANTADGTAILLKATAVPQRVIDGIVPRMVIGLNDFTGGTVEDMVTATYGTGLAGCVDGSTLKLLYKSAAGAAAVAVDASVYVKAPVTSTTVQYFQTAATSGGSVLDTTADGTVVWIKTS